MKPQRADKEILKALVPGKPTPAKAWTGLLLAALFIAGAIVGIVVWLTPKPADDPELVERLKQELNLQLAPTAPPPAVAKPILQLPQKPLEVSDQQLFETLEALADQMVAELPEDPAALHNAAMIHAELKQTTKAEELWRRCLDKHPSQAGPYVAYADQLMKLGRTDEAGKLLEDNWAQLAQWPAAVQVRAHLMDQLGEPEQAVQLLEASLKTRPDVADNWLDLGQLQNQLRQYVQAESSLRTAVGLGMKANETLIFALSTAVGRQPDREADAQKLRDVFQEMKKSSVDPSGNRFQESYSAALSKIAARALLNAAAMYNELGNYQRAEQVGMQLLALDPQHVTALMTLSSIFRKTGRLPDALIVQQRILELEPANPLNVINLASVLTALGSLEQAETVLKQAAEKATQDSGFLHAELAALYLKLERFDAARTYARQAVNRQATKEHYALLAAACKALDDKGGLFEAISAIERLNQGPQP